MHGLRILNTRPVGQNQSLSRAIKAAGGVPNECPLLAIEPIESTPDSISALGDLSTIQHAIFISTNAVYYFFEGLKALNLKWPSTIRVIAIGSSTARALNDRGVRVDDMPLLTGSESLLQLASMQCVKKRLILLVKGEFGRELIAETLVSRGATVLPMVVYRRVPCVENQEALRSLWRQDAVDVIVFTSEQAMHTLFSLVGKKAHTWLAGKPCWVISERLAVIATKLGIKNIKVEKLLEG